MFTILINYVKDNYLDLIIKALLSILSIVLIVLRSRLVKKYKLTAEQSAFLDWLPYAVHYANTLFPQSGSGSKKLSYVVEKCSSLFPSITLKEIVTVVDSVLNADKKGGDVCETVESQKTEGSQDFCEDSEEDQQNESSSTPHERWNTFLTSFRR